MAKNTALLWLFILVMAADLALPYLLAPFYKGYSHHTQVMSVLGNPASPVRAIYSLWLVAAGVGFGLGAWQLFLGYRMVSRPLATALLVLLLAFALGGYGAKRHF